ncbi:MAG: hypothetical protein JW768_08025 [Chitinispirillaceae bacterium]|nr:hypothetical protein [Chitinispirillaceae bacterium]
MGKKIKIVFSGRKQPEQKPAYGLLCDRVIAKYVGLPLGHIDIPSKCMLFRLYNWTTLIPPHFQPGKTMPHAQHACAEVIGNMRFNKNAVFPAAQKYYPLKMHAFSHAKPCSTHNTRAKGFTHFCSNRNTRATCSAHFCGAVCTL